MNQRLLRWWRRFTQVKARPAVTGWWRKLGLFIWLVVGQQVVVVVFTFFQALQLGWLGLAASVAVAWLYLKLVLSYARNPAPIQAAPFRPVGLTLIGLYAATLLWSWAGPMMLGLRMTRQATSGNQASIEALAHSGPSSAIFILATTVILAPMLEEFAFRYLALGPHPLNHPRLRFAWACGGFAFFHVCEQLPQVAAGELSLFAWLFYFGQYLLIGWALSGLYRRHRDYRLNVATHATWNLVAMIIQYL